MGFPAEFPALAVRQLGKLVTGADSDKGRGSLAGYELLGYALKQVFGDVQYLMEDSGEMAKALTQAPPEVQSFVAFCETNIDPQTGQLAAIPPFMIPLIFKAAEWFVKYLFERLNKQMPTP